MAWAGDTALSQIRKADKERERGGKGVGKGSAVRCLGIFGANLFVCLTLFACGSARLSSAWSWVAICLMLRCPGRCGSH